MSNSESEDERAVSATSTTRKPHAAVRKATRPRYGRSGPSGPAASQGGLRRERLGPRSPMRASSVSAVASDAPRKNKIHSILTALPVLMLVVGLYYFYSGESAQNSGSPIIDESIDADVVFDGMSVVRSGGEGRHYLWYDDGTRRRGARIHARQVPALASLQPGDRIAMRLAPTVSGSSVLWAWRVERGDTVLMETPPSEQ